MSCKASRTRVLASKFLLNQFLVSIRPSITFHIGLVLLVILWRGLRVTKIFAGVDPMNLIGILLSGGRVPAVSGRSEAAPRPAAPAPTIGRPFLPPRVFPLQRDNHCDAEVLSRPGVISSVIEAA